MKRLLGILKDLQDSGQEAAIIGQFTIQLGHIQDVINIDGVREQSKIGLSETGAGKNSNRYITEHGRNDVHNSRHALSAVLSTNLIEIIAAWSNLPDSVKTGIMAMVNALSKQGARLSK